ncbi:MAG TPA: STAS domain-containing protein [Acetobacteraceae bacterium]|nr:STAS domain-containing protein [Acetobacteraceae bacterium]
MVHLVSGSGNATPVRANPRLLIDAEDVAPGVTKLNLRGRLDAYAIQSISPTFDRMARTQTQLIVDLSRVTFIASTGLRTLISAGRSVASRGGRMVFLGPEPSVESVLITSGTDVVVPIHRDLASAVLAVSAGADDEDDRPATSLPFSLQVDRSMRGVARVNAWVDELAILLNLSQRAEYALRLSLEEAVSNIVTHARPLPGVDAEKVSLRLVAEPARLFVTIQDQCEEYNPLQAIGLDAPPDPTGEGGLGIGLLRQHAHDVTWSRVGPVNRLMLTIPR